MMQKIHHSFLCQNLIVSCWQVQSVRSLPFLTLSWRLGLTCGFNPSVDQESNGDIKVVLEFSEYTGASETVGVDSRVVGTNTHILKSSFMFSF